ncbi:MAG: DUF4230 domain-containing protein [Saprospiraceae bacterium]
MFKKIIFTVVLLGIGYSIFWGTKYYYTIGEIKATEQSEVLLEKIKTVSKLVTVEGYFSEVYDYKDYWGYDISPFRKKALMRVKAKVLVGYNLEKMTVVSLPKEKTIRIGNLPDPEIISIENDLDYYDISEGTFNSFSTADYNKLQQKAKDYIREHAERSDLKESAVKQGNQLLELIRFMVETSGWKLEFVRDLNEVPENSLIE